MKMMVGVATIGLVVFGLAGIVSGAVLFDEKFDTNLSAWTLLNTPGSAGTVDVGLNGGQLHVTIINGDRWRVQGVQSVAKYPMPTEAGKKLVFDFYGVNSEVDGDTQGYPWSAVCALPNTGGCFNGWNPNWVAVKGWDGYYGDWAQSSAIEYADLPGDNAHTFKHTIIAIDDANVSMYIADDYYENLANPTALYTTPTSTLFNYADLTNGLYVVIGAARYSSWYTGTYHESFDGVKVSHVGTVPADCAGAINLGYGFSGDVNRDCKVNFTDFAALAKLWLVCVDPQDALCDRPWENQ